MPRSTQLPLAGIALLLVSAAHTVRAQDHNPDAAVPPTQSFALADTKDLTVPPGVKAEAVEYRGRKAVRLTTEAVDAAEWAAGPLFGRNNSCF